MMNRLSSRFRMLIQNILLCNIIFVFLTKYNVVECATTTVPLRLYGLNYNSRQGPDWDPNKCKNATQVAADLKVLSRITSRIRILSLTDCGQADLVLAAIEQEQIDLSVWLGLWTSNVSSVFEGELQKLRSLLSAGQISNSRILGLTVGSEAIYRKELTSAQSIAYMGQVKDLLGEFSITDLPVAIVDVDDIYEQYSELFAASDVAFLNSFPFWEKVAIDNAIDFLNTKLVDVWNLADANGKSLILGETGWPSQGSNINASETSGENQAKYLQNFFCSYDVQQQNKYFYFTGIDSDWRVGQELDPTTVEGHFGILYHNLTLKPHFQDLVFTCPGSDSVQYRFDLSSDGSPIAPVPVPVTAPVPVPVPNVPIGDTPVSSPEASTLPVDTSPSDNSPTTGPRSCSNNPQCKKQGLVGKCCPTTVGTFLDCCNAENIPTGRDTSTSPVASPTATSPESTATSPTTMPVAAAPTGSPIVVDPTETPVMESPVVSPISPTKSPLIVQSDAPSVVSITPSINPYSSDAPSQSPTDEVAFNAKPSVPPAGSVDAVISAGTLSSSTSTILLLVALNGYALFTYVAHLL